MLMSRKHTRNYTHCLNTNMKDKIVNPNEIDKTKIVEKLSMILQKERNLWTLCYSGRHYVTMTSQLHYFCLSLLHLYILRTEIQHWALHLNYTKHQHFVDASIMEMKKKTYILLFLTGRLTGQALIPHITNNIYILKRLNQYFVSTIVVNN